MTASLHQLLVHFDDSPAALKRLDFARRLATQHGASVTALYSVTPSLIEVPFAAEAGGAAVAALREVDEQRAALAKQAFDAAVDDRSGVRAHWCEITDWPVATSFAEQALYADLVVIGQHNPKGDAGGVPFDLVETTLSLSGKPALVVPYAGQPNAAPQEIALAWKPTREAARAVAAAVPLMRKARRVHVLSWGEPPVAGLRGAKLDLDNYLRQRGVEPVWHRESGAEPEIVGELMLSRAFDIGCDLLVMGCYGHSRAREWVLGGASRTVLQSMTVPVLLAH